MYTHPEKPRSIGGARTLRQDRRATDKTEFPSADGEPRRLGTLVGRQDQRRASPVRRKSHERPTSMYLGSTLPRTPGRHRAARGEDPARRRADLAGEPEPLRRERRRRIDRTLDERRRASGGLRQHGLEPRRGPDERICEQHLRPQRRGRGRLARERQQGWHGGRRWECVGPDRQRRWPLRVLRRLGDRHLRPRRHRVESDLQA